MLTIWLLRVGFWTALVVPAWAQQQPSYNPDQSAYEINRNAVAIAGYSRMLEQRIIELQNAHQKQTDESQKQIEELNKENADLKAKLEAPK